MGKILIKALIVVGAFNMFAASALAVETAVPCAGANQGNGNASVAAPGAAGAPNPAPAATGAGGAPAPAPTNGN